MQKLFFISHNKIKQMNLKSLYEKKLKDLQKKQEVQQLVGFYNYAGTTCTIKRYYKIIKNQLKTFINP